VINIKHLKSEEPGIKYLNQIPVGTVFYGDVSYGFKNRLLLRIYGGLVDLEKPGTDWLFAGWERDPGLKTFDIKNYREVDIDIVVRPKGEQE
jgi:hypothetical protein